MKLFLWICLAGAAGTGVRRLAGVYVPRWLGATFPWATLVVNVGGCFLISFVAHLAAKKLVGEELRVALMTGFMGGLTTYSSFNLETTNLFFKDNAILLGGMNVALTLGLCFGAGLLGAIAGRWVSGA